MAIKKTDKPETLLQQTYQQFWEGFNRATAVDEKFCKEFTAHPYPSIRFYQDYNIGEPYHFVVGINFKRKEIRVGAYFRDLDAFLFYSEMLKGRIERKMETSLKWTRHQTKASAYMYTSADFDESHGWESAYEVMIAQLIKMKESFEFDPAKIR